MFGRRCTLSKLQIHVVWRHLIVWLLHLKRISQTMYLAHVICRAMNGLEHFYNDFDMNLKYSRCSLACTCANPRVWVYVF